MSARLDSRGHSCDPRTPGLRKSTRTRSPWTYASIAHENQYYNIRHKVGSAVDRLFFFSYFSFQFRAALSQFRGPTDPAPDFEGHTHEFAAGVEGLSEYENFCLLYYNVNYWINRFCALDF